MTAVLMTWNPSDGHQEQEHDACLLVSNIRADSGDPDISLRFWWDTGRRYRGIEKGVRFYVLQHGDPDRQHGIVRVGTALGPVEDVSHLQERWKQQVFVEWGDAVPQYYPLPIADLKRANLRWHNGNPVNWGEGGIRQGGYLFDAASEAKLDRLWSQHFQRYLGTQGIA